MCVGENKSQKSIEFCGLRGGYTVQRPLALFNKPLSLEAWRSFPRQMQLRILTQLNLGSRCPRTEFLGAMVSKATSVSVSLDKKNLGNIKLELFSYIGHRFSSRQKFQTMICGISVHLISVLLQGSRSKYHTEPTK